MHRPIIPQATQRIFPHLNNATQLRAGFSVFLIVIAVMYGVISTTASKAFFDSTPSQMSIASTPTVENSQTIPLLQAARNLDPAPARGGGDVVLSQGTALVVDTNPFTNSGSGGAKTATSDQISLYQVQEGDTLSQVATMFDVSVSTIVWANNLSSSKDIHAGQTLLILPVSGVQHTVVAGDTLQQLAKQYGGDFDEIIAYNDLPSNGSLVTGQTITIPGGEVPTKKAHTPTKTAQGANTGQKAGSSDYFTHPLPGSIRTQGLHGYNGVDLAAPAGTPIRAAAGGTVIVAKANGAWNGGYGNYVVIDHQNGTQTLYAHTTSNAVVQGQYVSQGETIGYVGSTGRSTGNHLHFEVRGGKNPF